MEGPSNVFSPRRNSFSNVTACWPAFELIFPASVTSGALSPLALLKVARPMGLCGVYGQGQVAHSTEANHGGLLLALAVLLWSCGGV